MNLSKLFELQRQLDEHIEREHPPKDDEHRFEKKILALQVELGELANEWRGFKFWSHDQEPRTEMYKFSPLHNEPLIVKMNPLLEEYVDCLHFILSIGSELGIDKKDSYLKSLNYYSINSWDVLNYFGYVFSRIAKFSETVNVGKPNNYSFATAFSAVLQLGHKLGFTWEEIEQAYMEKNRINLTIE